MKTGFSYERRMINRLVLESFKRPFDISLFYGQTGISIVIAIYASQNKDAKALDLVADHLFSNVSERVGHVSSYNLGDGIAGIIWALEFLVQKGLMEGSANEMCQESDMRLMELDICRIRDYSLEKGLLGLWHCVWARIQGNMLRSEPLPYDRNYLLDWLNVLDTYPKHFEEGASQRLSRAFRGELDFIPLTLYPFIEANQNKDKIGLKNGLAGYVYKKYIEEI